MINRVEADPKSPDFSWVILLDASANSLDSLPVFFCEGGIIEGIESWSCQSKDANR